MGVDISINNGLLAVTRNTLTVLLYRRLGLREAMMAETIRLHIFSGFENKRLGITPDTEVGHLYSLDNDLADLEDAAVQIGLKLPWLQVDDTGFKHFDVWDRKLDKARRLFVTVDDVQFAEDLTQVVQIMQRLTSEGGHEE